MAGLLDILDPAKRPLPTSPELPLEEAVKHCETTRLIVHGAQFEQQKQREDEEAVLAQQLYAMLEEEYSSFLVLKDNKSADTVRKYTISAKAFCQFCNELRVSPRPAKPAIVAAWLDTERKNGAKPEMIRRHSASISYLHRFANLADPTTDPLVRAVVFSSTKGRYAADEH